MLSTRVGYRTIEKSRIPCTIRKNRSVPWVVAVPEEFGKHPSKAAARLYRKTATEASIVAEGVVST